MSSWNQLKCKVTYRTVGNQKITLSRNFPFLPEIQVGNMKMEERKIGRKHTKCEKAK